MQDAVDALIAHISNGFNGGPEKIVFQTVDQLADEFDEKGEIKRSVDIPACLISTPEMEFGKQNSPGAMHIFVITSSISFDKDANRRDNLGKATALVRWIVDETKSNRIFSWTDYNYQISVPVHARLFDLDGKFCVVQIGLDITERKTGIA